MKIEPRSSGISYFVIIPPRTKLQWSSLSTAAPSERGTPRFWERSTMKYLHRVYSLPAAAHGGSELCDRRVRRSIASCSVQFQSRIRFSVH